MLIRGWDYHVALQFSVNTTQLCGRPSLIGFGTLYRLAENSS